MSRKEKSNSEFNQHLGGKEGLSLFASAAALQLKLQQEAMRYKPSTSDNYRFLSSEESKHLTIEFMKKQLTLPVSMLLYEVCLRMQA